MTFTQRNIRQAKSAYVHLDYPSDLLASVQAFNGWACLPHDERFQWCEEKSLSNDMLSRILEVRSQIRNVLFASGITRYALECIGVGTNVLQDAMSATLALDLYDSQPHVLIAMLAAAFKGNIAVQLSPRLLRGPSTRVSCACLCLNVVDPYDLIFVLSRQPLSVLTLYFSRAVIRGLPQTL